MNISQNVYISHFVPNLTLCHEGNSLANADYIFLYVLRTVLAKIDPYSMCQWRDRDEKVFRSRDKHKGDNIYFHITFPDVHRLRKVIEEPSQLVLLKSRFDLLKICFLDQSGHDTIHQLCELSCQWVSQQLGK